MPDRNPTASLSKYHFSAGVELMSIVPNFVMSKNSMMQMCSGQLSDLNLTLCLIAKKSRDNCEKGSHLVVVFNSFQRWFKKF